MTRPPSATLNTLSGEINLLRDPADVSGSFVERRAKPRIHQPFSTTVSGTDIDGRPFELQTELGNVSSGGLYLRLPQRVGIGQDLRFVINFSNGINVGAVASVLGRVLRVDADVDGLNGFGLAITEYEFI